MGANFVNPAASSGLVLAIDIGTSSLRTALFDRQAERLVHTTAQWQYELDYPKGGGAERGIHTAVVRRSRIRTFPG